MPSRPEPSDDVEPPKVYALLFVTSQAAARAHLDEGVRARLLAIVFDGLTPRPRPVRDTPRPARDMLKPVGEE